eukprot:5281551-Pyramimonas_sp.AAC.1
MPLAQGAGFLERRNLQHLVSFNESVCTENSEDSEGLSELNSDSEDDAGRAPRRRQGGKGGRTQWTKDATHARYLANRAEQEEMNRLLTIASTNKYLGVDREPRRKK